MPRAAVVTEKEAIDALKNYAEYFTVAELPKYTSPVWNNISKELKGKWSAHSVYTNVREDRRRILTQTREDLGICLLDTNNNSRNYSFADTTANESALNISKRIDADPDYKKKPDFHLVIKNDLWKTIRPEVPVDYADRTYFILEPQVWTHTIFHQFWKQFRLPCAYSFKRAKVHPSPESQHYIVIMGKCTSKQCSNEFTGYVEKEPSENVDIIIEVHTRDTSYDDHEIVQRPLAGIQRQQVSKEIVSEGCSNWRKRTAREEMDIGDLEPPLLYKPDVLRQAKKEKIEKELGVGKTDGGDIVRAIEEMMVTSPYTGSVQAVGSNPFYAFYRSPVQLYTYKEYCRLRKDSAFISIDATGSIVQSLPRGSNNKSGHIFLYAIVINFDGCTISVNQMLSEKHETEFIEFWLKQWIRQVPKPPEAVCDYSRALLCALALAFNNQTIKSYINTCFLFLMANSASTANTTRPVTTFIRVDVAHLIHLVSLWKCFTAIRQTAIKDFFIRCVALMVNCQTIDRLHEIYLLTSIVAIHPYNGHDRAGHFQESAQSARKKLESYIAVGDLDTNELLQNNQNNEKSEIEDNYMDDEEPIGAIEQWVKNLQTFAEEGMRYEIGDLNAFYLPDFFKHLRQLMKEFPLWTGVMIPFFHSKYEHASSSFVEGYFNDVKTRVMTKYGKPLRADKFLKMHLQDLSGGARIFSSKLICYRMTNQKTNNHSKSNKENNTNIGSTCENENFDDLDLMSVENWRNKGSKISKTSSMELENIVEIDISPDNHSDISEVCFEELSLESAGVVIYETSQKNTRLEDGSPDIVNLDPTECPQVSVQNFVGTQENAKEASKKRSKYFRPFPEIEHYNNVNSLKKGYLLKNGNICKPIPTEKVKTRNGKMIQCKLIPKNTCGFDATAQLLLTSALDYADYRCTIEKSNNATLQFVSKVMEDGPNADVLKERAMLLKPLYPLTVKAELVLEGITVIESFDAWANVMTLWNQLMASEPSAYTTRECSNDSCPVSRTASATLTVNHNDIAKLGFKSLEKALQFSSSIKSTMCPKKGCIGRCTISRQANYHLFVELDIRIDITAPTGMKCFLRDLPKEIRLSQDSFRLSGVIAYTSGHYVAYCRRLGGHWELYNDTAASVKPVTSNTKIVPHAVLYVASL